MQQRYSILTENVANMAPSWPPKSSKNREKIDAKIDQKIDAFRDRVLSDVGGFGDENGRKLAPKWGQKRTQLRSTIFSKIVPSLQREHDF